MRRHLRVLLLFLLSLRSALALAQDAVKLTPKSYKILFENEKVRVTEERLTPGEKEHVHSHPCGVFACFLCDAHIRSTFPDGKTSEDSKKAGGTVWRDPVIHAGRISGIQKFTSCRSSQSQLDSDPGPWKLCRLHLGFTNTQPTDAREPYHRFKYENPYIRRVEVLLEPGEPIFFTPIPMTSCA